MSKEHWQSDEKAPPLGDGTYEEAVAAYRRAVDEEEEIIPLDTWKTDLKKGRNGVKAPLQWIPMWAMAGAARVFDYGARKYEPGNWQRAAKDGTDALEDYLSAAQRHWAAIQKADAKGVAVWESLDEESGLPHFDHMLTSLIMARGIAILADVMPADPGRGKDLK